MSDQREGDETPKTISEKVRPVVKQMGRNLVARNVMAHDLETQEGVVLETALSVAGSILLGFSVLEKIDDALQNRVLFASTLAGYSPAVAEHLYAMYQARELDRYRQTFSEEKP